MGKNVSMIYNEAQKVEQLLPFFNGVIEFFGCSFILFVAVRELMEYTLF